MRIWLINPFDPLPGGREQLGRYGFLVRCLLSAGHAVTWWTSGFSHRFKRPIDREEARRAAVAAGIELEILDAPPYRKNVSLARLWNHDRLGRCFARRAAQAAPPDLLLVSSPPLELAAAAAGLGRRWDVPVVVDIQDQWPDNFVRVMPGWLRPIGAGLLRPFYALERRAYTGATAIVGVARGYVARGTEVGGPKPRTGVFPLGVDLADVRAAMTAGRERHGERWTKPPGTVWLLYSGSLSHNYDFLTCIRAAAAAQPIYGERVRFLVTGQGELAGEAERIIRTERLRNVTLTGFLDFAEYACILGQADAGFNASFPDALIYLPNKIFFYLAAGAAILNTIPGECADLVAGRGPGGLSPCGLTYAAGDPAACLAAIRTLVDEPQRLRDCGAESLRLAETVYDRRLIYAEYVRFLVELRSDYSAQRPH